MRRLEEEIDKLDQDIDKYHKYLESVSIVLFTSTLGCWSVTGNKYLQLVAYYLSLMLFSRLITSEWKQKISFPKRHRLIQRKIQRIPDGNDYKLARSFQCQKIGKKISLWRLPFRTPSYLSAVLFYLVSMTVFLYRFVY